MKYRLLTMESLYRKYIRLARARCKGTVGYDRAISLCAFFKAEGHPNPDLIFDDMLSQQTINRNFNADLAKSLANFLAEKNEGFIFTGIEGQWLRTEVVENIFFEHTIVCSYIQKNSQKSIFLLTKEQYRNVNGYKFFYSEDECKTWLENLKSESNSPLDYLHRLVDAFPKN